MRPFTKVVLAAAVLAGAIVLVPGAHAESCDTYDVEYTTAANLELKDTPMNAGNGVYRVGPGRVTIRFAGNDARMLAYELHEKFVVDTTALFWKTKVSTDVMTRATPDANGVVASGTLSGRTLKWNTPTRGYHTDGTLICDGSLCGKFGAPAPGQSELHYPPADVQFKPFTLSEDRKTFSMPNTWVGKSEMPKQTASIALSGREARRTCVQAPAPGP